MQSVSSRIWTRVAVSISYDDNDYTTGTSMMDNNDGWWERERESGNSVLSARLDEDHFDDDFFFITMTWLFPVPTITDKVSK